MKLPELNLKPNKMTELETKIWNTVHNWCDAQSNKIPDQNRRYLMDEINALVLSHVVGQREQLKAFLSVMIEEFDNGGVSWETRDSAESLLKSL
jgi:hypothetical protein